MKSTTKSVIIFIVLFVVFSIVGSFLGGNVLAINEKGFYAFFYYTIPSFLGKAVGLPIGGVAGKIFALIASIVLMVMSINMSNIYTEDGEWDGLNALSSYSLSFIFFAVASTVMMDQNLVFGFLYHKILLAFPILFLLGCIVLTFMKLGKGIASFAQSLKYLLSSLGFAVSCAGLSSLILNVKMEKLVAVPVRIAEFFLNIAGSINPGILQGILLIVCQAALVLIALVFIALLIQNEYISYNFSAGIFIMYMFFSYMIFAGTTMVPQELKYWLLLFALVFVYAKRAKINGHSYTQTVIGGIGFMIAVPTIYFSLIYFYEPINASFDTLLEKITPAKIFLLNFVNSIFTADRSSLDMNPVAMGVITAVIAVVTGLLYLPLKGKRNESYDVLDNPHLAIICSLTFLVGVITKSFGFTHHIILKIAYGFIVVPTILGICFLVASIIVKDKNAVRNHCYAFIVTLIISPLCSFFAQAVGIMLAAVALGIMVIATIMGNLGSSGAGSTRVKQLYNMGAYHDAIDQLNEQIANGEKSYSDAQKEAIAVAAIALNTHQALQESINDLNDK